MPLQCVSQDVVEVENRTSARIRARSHWMNMAGNGYYVNNQYTTSYPYRTGHLAFPADGGLLPSLLKQLSQLVERQDLTPLFSLFLIYQSHSVVRPQISYSWRLHLFKSKTILIFGPGFNKDKPYYKRSCHETKHT
jgi:hypothetical protein